MILWIHSCRGVCLAVCVHCGDALRFVPYWHEPK